MLAAAGFLGGGLNKLFSRDSRMTIMVIVLGVTFVCETIYYLLQVILSKISFDFMVLKTIGIEMVYNMMIVIIIYPLLQGAGRLIERIFTESKTLTRYF
jgi:cell shape-determining protein MreD